MAITKAQQARQMLIKGGVVHSDGRRGFFVGAERDARQGRGDISPGTDREGNQRPGPDNPRRGGAGPNIKPKQKPPGGGDPKMKYTKPPINRFELAEENRKRKERIAREQERKQRLQLGVDSTTKFGTPFSPKFGTPVGPMSPKERNIFDLQKIKLAKSAIEDDEEDEKRAKEIAEQNPLEKFLGNFKPPSVALIEGILSKIPGKSLREMYDIYGDEAKGGDYKTFDDYARDVLAGKISTKGGLMGGRFRDSQGNILGGREGPDNQPVPQAAPTTTASTTTTSEAEDVDDIFKGELAARFGGSLFDFDKLRANAMDGGIMNTDVIGGFADDSMDEMGRQMYGLGKLVKKVTKGVKKIAKSPIGKAALLYFGGNALTGGGLKSFLLGSNAGPSFSKTGILKKMFLKNPSLGFSLGNISPVAGIFGTSALSGLMTPKEQNKEEEEYLGPSIDIPAIRARRRLAAAFDGSTYNYEDYADGGRIGYQDGSKEPVAKKTMPLIDMDGMEKDYRETGGFVEMGRMERADDVPARLSKNEFVFTADAVRNAGDGSVDKGAEVMYNMMKNLEAGGEVSEESQGLKGARKMFQTSQRLGEVI